jgi:hypothetical protein
MAQPKKLRRVERPKLRAAIGILGCALFVMGLTAVAMIQQGLTADEAPTAARSEHAGQYSDAAIQAAANQLLAAVTQTVATNVHVTDFAKEKIAWILTQKRAGALSVTLLKNAESANLDFEALMAAGSADGRPTIVIAQPRLVAFLVEGGHSGPAFSRQQVNDFMLGLVHETVHLQNPQLGHLTSVGDRIQEELRTWREVDLHVVQQLRAHHEAMNVRFLEVNDAVRSCGNRLPCEPLRELLFPNTPRH